LKQQAANVEIHAGSLNNLEVTKDFIAEKATCAGE
jgi:hypothetical protein